MMHLRISCSLAVTIAIVTVAGARSGSAACPDFSGPSNIFTANEITYPDALATGDFNGDGKLDVAVAGIGSVPNVLILIGNGSGGFTKGSNFDSGGNSPRGIATGDFNRDGKLDLAIANSNSDSVTIHLGSGTGTFTQASGSPIAGMGGVFSVAVGDVNGDGKPDVAAANSSGGNVAILLGNGSGGFAAAPSGAITDGLSTPHTVALADLNGDGKLDLVVANNQSTIVVFRGDGTGAFTSVFTGPIGHSASHVSVADLNGDGRPDIVEADVTHNLVRIFLQQANGTFSTSVPYSVGSNPRSAAIADINGDGKLDLAVANDNSNNLAVLLGAGDGTFGGASYFGTDYNPQAIVAGDFNGDGKPDLATANVNVWTVSILMNDGVCPASACGMFAPPNTSTAGNGPSAAATADFDRDGKLDLAITNITSNNVSILLGNGSGGFGTVNTYGTGTSPIAVAAGDFNGDGKVDVATVNNSSDNVSILLSNGDGTFGTKTDFAVGTSPSKPRGIAIGDFNRDGKPDIAVTCGMSLQLTILLDTTATGSATPSFTSASMPAGSGSGPRGVSAADFNRDGKLDLAVANFGDGLSPGNVAIFIGVGDGTFASSNNYPANIGPYAAGVGDFNRDGLLDLAVPNLTTNDVSILIGNGSGAFAAGTTYVVGASPRFITVGDFDGDGKLDLATANSSVASVLRGNGDGTFANRVNYASGTNALSIASGDFNRDGKLDLAVANNSGVSNNVAILLNSCADLAITKSHTGDFTQGQVGVTYTITVSNQSTSFATTAGVVTVTDTLPTGLTATAMSGTNWACTPGTPAGTCTRSDSLAPNSSYEPITLTVTVDHDAPATVTNTVNVSGAGESSTNNTATDPANVNVGLPAPGSLVAGATSTTEVTVTWSAVPGAVSYHVYRSSNNQPFALAGTVTGTPPATTFNDSGLTPDTTYLYVVDAGGTSNDFSPVSNVDLATTIVFTNIVANSTVIRAADLIQLQTAVNAALTAAGLPTQTFTDPTGQLVTPGFITDLRTALDSARSAIGVPALSYTDPSLASGDAIKAAHLSDLQSGAK